MNSPELSRSIRLPPELKYQIFLTPNFLNQMNYSPTTVLGGFDQELAHVASTGLYSQQK